MILEKSAHEVPIILVFWFSQIRYLHSDHKRTVRWDVCDRRLWRRQGSKKEWQQHGDRQVPLVGAQPEPILQQELSGDQCGQWSQS